MSKTKDQTIGEIKVVGKYKKPTEETLEAVSAIKKVTAEVITYAEEQTNFCNPVTYEWLKIAAHNFETGCMYLVKAMIAEDMELGKADFANTNISSPLVRGVMSTIKRNFLEDNELSTASEKVIGTYTEKIVEFFEEAARQ